MSLTCLAYRYTQLCEAPLHHDIPCKPLDVAGIDVFMVNSNNLLCIVNYCSNFPGVKMLAGLSVHDLVQAAKIKSTPVAAGLPSS